MKPLHAVITAATDGCLAKHSATHRHPGLPRSAGATS